jgi:hypothetical protein
MAKKNIYIGTVEEGTVKSKIKFEDISKFRKENINNNSDNDTDDICFLCKEMCTKNSACNVRYFGDFGWFEDNEDEINLICYHCDKCDSKMYDNRDNFELKKIIFGKRIFKVDYSCRQND